MASIKLKGATSGEITISSPSVAGTNTLELQATSGTLATTAQASVGTKNLIINGNMQIAQRGTSETGVTSTGYLLDRMRHTISVGTWTISQDTDVPTGQGFSNSIKYQCTTTGTLTTGSVVQLQQRFEGQNLQHLKKGTSNSESLTLSFWVKSNKIGTYIAEFYDADNARIISKSYTIDTADTWEKKTLTFDGDTTGAFDNDNGPSLRLIMWLAASTDFTSGTLQTSWGSVVDANQAVGQVNLADSVSNYINFTGVQLEVGTTATPFENLMYSQQLAMCQRYYYKWDTTSSNNWVAWAMAANTTNMYGHVPFPTTMRSNPGSIVYSGLGWWVGGAVTAFSGVSIAESGTDSCTMSFASTGLTAQKMYGVLPNGATNYIAFVSEL